jgi:hypothetical protein
LLAPAAAWASETGAPKAAVAALVLPAIAGMLIWLLSLAWLPRFMRPAWVRTAEQEQMPRVRQKGR